MEYFKTFQVFSSLKINSVVAPASTDFKTFQVFSSYNYINNRG